jgi:serine/threonine-protein kinase PpkA
MEYVNGGNLRDHIRDGLSPGAALSYMLAIGSALKAAHDAQIVHRDVKPANILFRQNGTLLLTDFGIAKQLASNKGLTLTGSMVGSPYYLSPEQALGHPTDGRSDIYSLGIVLYEMLVGEKPFEGDSEIGIAMRHIEGELPCLPQELSPFQALLDRMTAKHPDHRFSDMTSLLFAAECLRDTGMWIDTDTAAPVTKTAFAPGTSPRSERRARATEKTLLLAKHGQEASASADQQKYSEIGNNVDRLRSTLRPIVLGRIAKFAAVASVSALVGVLITSSLNDDKKQEMILSESTSSPTAKPAELTRQTEPDSQIELEKQSELDRQAELEIKSELERQTELKEKAELEIKVELKKQAELAKQAEITELLHAAQTALSEYELTTPADGNAYYYYQEVLKRDPENTEAIEGFSKIADRYLDLAKKAGDRQQYKKANSYVTLGLRVQNDHPGLLALRQRLTHQANKKQRPVANFFQNVKRIFE